MSSILDLASSGDSGNLLREMRVRAIYSPYYLVKAVLGYPHLVDHLHQTVLELFIQRWINGTIKQGIEFPRGFFKTTMFTIGTGIWITLPVSDQDHLYALDVMKIPGELWNQRVRLHDQNATQLVAMETIPNAKKKIFEIKGHYERTQLFRTLFPEIAYQGTETPWNTDCIRIRRDGFGERQAEGTFEAIGVDGALQSRHYKIVWEDDLVGKAATESPTLMLSTIRWHGLLAGAFENAAYQTRFLVSNRWGYEDLNGYVRKHESDFQWHTTAAYHTNSEGKEVSVFPERYPMDRLIKIRDGGSLSRYDFSCQYLNRPTMPGEQEVDFDKLHTYEVLEGGKISCSCGASFFPSQLLRFMHYDPFNAKGVRSTSCPAIAVIGTSVDRHLFLLDYYTYKGTYSQVFEKIFSMNKRWRPCKFTYEDVGAQNMAEFFIKQTQNSAGFEGVKLQNIQAIPTRGKPKEVRIRDYFFPIIRGNGERKFSYRKNQLLFQEQLESFPSPSLEHDYDLLDVLAQGAQVWRFPVSDEDAMELKHSETAAIAKLGRPYSHLEVRI